MEISPHRSDVSSNVPAHVCCGMSGYPVISCRGSWHGFMWCRRLCYFWLSRHPWPFAHFWAVFVKMGFCAETSMPGICTSWGWGQQNSAEGHASWSSPRAENFLPAVLLCGRWLEDPGRALRPLRPGMVAGHLSHLSCSEFSGKCARPTVPTTRQTMYLLQACHEQFLNPLDILMSQHDPSIFNKNIKDVITTTRLSDFCNWARAGRSTRHYAAVCARVCSDHWHSENAGWGQ